jgi:phospholipid transport system substrate-binding protein
MTERATKGLWLYDVMCRSLLSCFFALIALVSLAAPPPVNPADAVAFMNQLWDRAVILLNNQTDAAIRMERFRELFRADFDGPGIAQFVLGRYWRSASSEEQQEFMKLFEDYIVFVYTARLSNFGGEIMKVCGSRSDGDGVIVSTDMVSTGRPAPLRIDWRLVSHNGSNKISDVIVESVSMAVTQRSEFAAVVQRNGGQVRGLLAQMREKTASATH